MSSAEWLVVIFGLVIFCSVVALSARIGVVGYSPRHMFQKDPQKFRINTDNMYLFLVILLSLFFIFIVIGLIVLRDIPTSVLFGLINSVPAGVALGYWVLLEEIPKK